jgi:hypothetical protein
MNDVFSVLIGKQGIIQNLTHNAENKFSIVLNFKVTPEMLPTSNLIVYYIQPSGDVVFNQLKLKFDEILGNNVSFLLNKKFD